MGPRELRLPGFLLGDPKGQGGLQGLDLVMQLLDFAKLGGVTEDGADGAEADFRVWTLQEVAEANDGLEGEALEAAFGESGGLALQLGKLAAEVGVLEPTVQSAAAHLGEAGGLGDGGGGGEYGESRLLARGGAGVFYFRAFACHFEPCASVAV